MFTLLIAATFAISSCGNPEEQEKADDNTEVVHQDHAGYQCPMKCEGDKTYDKPGSCPVCGMDMEELEG